MKFVKLLLVKLMLLAAGAAYSESEAPLFQFSTKTDSDFELTLKEMERKGRVSVLKRTMTYVGNARTASEFAALDYSRVDPKAVCPYAKMAFERGFEYWVTAHSEEDFSEEVVIGFPKSRTENLAETLGPQFANKPMGPVPVKFFTELCELTNEADSPITNK